MDAPKPSALCFLDILGFSALIERLEQEDDFGRLWFMDFLAAHSQPLSEIEKIAGVEQVTMFSDCCVVSNQPSRLNWVVAQSRCLAQYLLRMGALSRGSIVLGNLHHSERLLYGTGLVKAYQMEQSQAVYPRIVLDRSIVDLLLPIDEHHLAIEWREVLKLDSDGQWYVDLFAKPFGPPTKTFRNMVDDQEWLARFRLVLNKLIEEEANPRHLSKIAWACERFNSALGEKFGGTIEPLDVRPVVATGTSKARE